MHKVQWKIISFFLYTSHCHIHSCLGSRISAVPSWTSWRTHFTQEYKARGRGTNRHNKCELARNETSKLGRVKNNTFCTRNWVMRIVQTLPLVFILPAVTEY
ncbi:hypothetical protein F5890DRAFT_1483287 [Lentinula detonsa]|uniref:Uncharacterized protein n=1 Tax=Lentinula detonsa TaxID=2804962 RepID=A0AA38QAW4_9AGAR|nr:hypothetical protein F5890DRAFT_1483287 [Lentinula detonsa]